eukprot:3807575-Amphidinium_carterae.1
MHVTSLGVREAGGCWGGRLVAWFLRQPLLVQQGDCQTSQHDNRNSSKKMGNLRQCQTAIAAGSIVEHINIRQNVKSMQKF